LFDASTSGENRDPCGLGSVCGTLDSGSLDIGDFWVCGLAESWYQTEGSMVHAEGSIDSSIPLSATDPYYSVEGTYGGPGIVSYNSGTTDFGDGGVSEESWLFSDDFTTSLNFNFFYETFDSPIADNLNDGVLPGPVPPETLAVFYSQDAVAISGGTVSSGETVILMVQNSVTFTGNIDVAVGGFGGVFATGDIQVDGGVTNLEGIYFSQGTFDSCFSGLCDPADQLVVEGNVWADDFVLGRNLADNQDPAEYFRYRPDFLFNCPQQMMITPHVWQELGA
jgi:hypothetical protein